MEYSSGPSADSNPVYPLVSFKSATFPLPKSPSLTRVKKWCQHMPPQFRSNLPIAPKLMLIMITNVQTNICLPNKWRIEFPFYPRAKVINMSVSPSVGIFPVAFPCSIFSPKNKPVLPPPSQPQNPLGFRRFKLKNHRSGNDVHLRDPRGTFPFSIRSFAFYTPSDFFSHISHFRLYFQNLRGNVIIPLENQPSMI